MDEINHEEGDITCLLKSFWGECFYLGGLGGVPFVGHTGFGAYAHHGTSVACSLFHLFESSGLQSELVFIWTLGFIFKLLFRL